MTFVSPALCPRCQGQTLGLGDEGWWCLGLWQLLAVWWELEPKAMLLDLLAALAADRWLGRDFMNSISWCVALVTGGRQ